MQNQRTVAIRECAGLPAHGAVESVESGEARGVSFWVLAPPVPLTHHVGRHLIQAAELSGERAREAVVVEILGRGEVGGGMVVMGPHAGGQIDWGRFYWLGD